MRGTLLLALTLSAVAGCRREKPTVAPAAPPLALASLVPQRMVVVPAHAITVQPGLSWAAQVTAPRATLRALDTAFVAALEARGLASQWVMPDAVVRSWRRNPTYATDPYTLGLEPFRGAREIAPDARLPEPVATQLRTIVALQDARYVLVPLELRVQKLAGDTTAAAPGQLALRLLVIDARLSSVRWAGEVRTDPAAGMSPALLAAVATRAAELFVER